MYKYLKGFDTIKFEKHMSFGCDLNEFLNAQHLDSTKLRSLKIYDRTLYSILQTGVLKLKVKSRVVGKR